MQPTVLGNRTARSAQVRASDLAARVTMKQPKSYTASMLGLRSDQEQLRAFGASQIFTCSRQWDETFQRMKSLRPSATMHGARLRSGGAEVQVIGQHGHVQIYFTRTSEVTDHQLVFCRPMLLAEQAADGILEALSRTMPFFVDMPAALLRILETCNVVVCVWHAAGLRRTLSWCVGGGLSLSIQLRGWEWCLGWNLAGHTECTW